MKVAVLGAGYWGPNLVRVFQAHPRVRGVVVCDKDPARLVSARRLFPGIEVAAEARAVLDDASVGAVAVALPASLHFACAREALQAGKHVFVEKPLALRVAECEALVALAEGKGRILQVGHQFLYNAAVRKARDIIASGDLGAIYYLYAQRLNLGVVRQDVNVIWTLAPHDVSITLHLFDERPRTVAARGMAFLQAGIEDVAFLHLAFPSGRHAHVHLSWLDPSKVRRVTIVGDRKMLVYDDTSPDEKVRVYDKGISRKNIEASLGEFSDFGSYQMIQRAGDVLIPKIDFHEPLAAEIDDFVASIEQGRPPLSDGRVATDVVRVLEAAARSLASGAAEPV